MSDLKLKPCPMCGCRAEFDYGAPMNSGKRIVKVKCAIGCVEQNIFRCEEQDAAAAWNSRTRPEAAAPAIQQPQGQDRGIELAFMGVPPGRCPHEFDCDVAGANYSIWRCRHCGAERKR